MPLFSEVLPSAFFVPQVVSMFCLYLYREILLNTSVMQTEGRLVSLCSNIHVCPLKVRRTRDGVLTAGGKIWCYAVWAAPEFCCTFWL